MLTSFSIKSVLFINIVSKILKCRKCVNISAKMGISIVNMGNLTGLTKSGVNSVKTKV